MIGVQRASLLGDEGARLLGTGIEHRLEARRDQDLLELRVRHDLAGGVGDLVDDRLRHAGGREQAVEIAGHHAGQAGFDRGRYVGRAP